MKRCISCNRHKEESRFGMKPRRCGGRSAVCLVCQIKGVKEPEKIKCRTCGIADRVTNGECRECSRSSRQLATLESAKLSCKHTYLVHCNGYFKIGVCSKGGVEKRINNMQTGNPRKIELIAISESNIEKQCHYELEHHRVRGEWFVAHPEVAALFFELQS